MDNHTLRLATVALGIGFGLAVVSLPGPAAAQVGGMGATMNLSTITTRSVMDVLETARIVDARPIIDTARISTTTSIAIDAGNRRVAFGMSDGAVRLWDVSAGAEIGRVAAHGSTVSAMTFAAGGQIAALSTDGTIKLVNSATGRVEQLPGSGSRGLALAAARGDSRLFIAFADGSVQEWKPGSPLAKVLDGVQGGAPVMALSDDGSTLAVGSGTSVTLLDLASRAAVPVSLGDARVTALAFIGRTSQLLAADAEGSVRLLGRNGVEKSVSVTNAGLTTLATSHDGRFFATGGDKKGLHLFDLTTGRRVKGDEDPPKVKLSTLTFSANDSTILAVGDNGIVHLFDARKATETAKVVMGSDGWIVLGRDGEFDKAGSAVDAVQWGNDDDKFKMEQFTTSHFEPGLLATTMNPELAAQSAQFKAAEAAELAAAAKPAEPAPQPAAAEVKPVAQPEAKPEQPVERPSLAKSFARPPEVKFDSVPDQKVEKEEVQLSFTAKDLGGGLSEVRLFQNGKVVLADNVKTRSLSSDNSLTLNFTAKLAEGRNDFKLVAVNKERIESVPETVTMTYITPAGAAPKGPTLHVITVGINKYKNPALNLDYGVPDARGIADFFVKQPKSLFSNVVLYTLHDEAATRAQVMALLDGLNTLKPEDVAVIYLAGHGETVGSMWYFIPHDMTRPEKKSEIEAVGISSTQIDGYIQKVGARKVLLMIDACKSGAALLAVRGFEERKALAKLARATGIHMIAAAARDQFANELPTLGHGIFTYTVLQGLGGQAKQGSDGTVSIRDLTSYVEDQLPQLSETHAGAAQYPIVDSRGMDFPIALASAAPASPQPAAKPKK